MVKESRKPSKAKAQVTPPVQPAEPQGEAAPRTPAQEAALAHAQDANLDHVTLTAAYIVEFSKELAASEDYQGAVFTLADFDALVERGDMEAIAGVYTLKNEPLYLTDTERAFILAARAGDWSAAGVPFFALMGADETVQKKVTEPPYKLVSFRAPDPAYAYGYDYKDDVMPHEEIAVAIFYDLVKYAGLPRSFTVGGGASEFIEQIVGAMEGAFEHIEAIELAQLILAVQNQKDE